MVKLALPVHVPAPDTVTVYEPGAKSIWSSSIEGVDQLYVYVPAGLTVILIEPLPVGAQVVFGVVIPVTLIGGLVLLTAVVAVTVHPLSPVTVTE